MIKTIPIFHDHSDFSSTLTFLKEKECKSTGPSSIVSICKENGIQNCYYVSKNFYSFFEAYKNLKEKEINLIFGLEILMCDDASQNTPESRKNEHKIIVFMKNSQGYHDLVRIYNDWRTKKENFYFYPRYDFNQLNPLWTENIILAVPFFDSFLCKNLLTWATIVPKFPVKPILFREVNSGLPFAHLIDKAIDEFNKDNSYEEQPVKNIYYKDSSDLEVKAWQLYRCIHNRSSFQKPEMEHCCSRNFSFDNYKSLC